MGQLKKHYEGFHNWFQFYRLQTTTNELTNVEVASVTYDTEVSYYHDNFSLIKCLTRLLTRQARPYIRSDNASDDHSKSFHPGVGVTLLYVLYRYLQP